jgi:prepilin-type N-terminal cleavage/methylation domain-containing protein
MSFFKNKKGFTIPELIVSIAVISAIASVVIFNQSKFNNDIEITNLAYRLGLAIRQAQVYGVSVRELGTGNFNSSYGVHFYIAGGASDNKSFVFFRDINSNDRYDGVESTGCDNECIERTVIGRGNYIERFCAYTDPNNPTAYNCIPNGQSAGPWNNNVVSFDVLFKRPNPDARLYAYKANGDSNGLSNPYQQFVACLKSPQGRMKQITVYLTGQVSVQEVTTAPCTP